MPKDDRLEVEGVVVESSNGKFKVKINDSLTATCTLSGKIRLNSVKIIVGDRVLVELCQYELTKGRIIYRMK